MQYSVLPQHEKREGEKIEEEKKKKMPLEAFWRENINIPGGSCARHCRHE
jgi:hypothetical protein